MDAKFGGIWPEESAAIMPLMSCIPPLIPLPMPDPNPPAKTVSGVMPDWALLQ